ncbi:hypothetical protein [Marinospirillum insulare]|uniref:NolW-like domain-containing protein n=1 Tax=Marinospirillum insulare TaxID=217169 RepID=A0ABQ5ZZ26_9GAMM|nr:hypothetical protein [Marinospirillum insulare]GLR64637.1 hypothetical protein GCM10007878_20750 [Marinospirillum insulare]
MRQEPKSYKPYYALTRAFLLLLLLVQCIVPEVKAEDAHKIQLIELEHRPATEILSAIKPHLPKGAAASLQNQKIVLSGQSSDLAQLAILIDALDQPALAWRVLFAQGQINLEATQQKSIRHYSTARSDIFELLVREEGEARLERGFWIPVETMVGQQRQTGYEWLASGVWVSVKPLGDQLIVNLTSQQAKQGNTNARGRTHFAGRQFEGEVALHLGRWTTLGSEAKLAAQNANAARRYVGGSTSEFYSICIELSDQASCPR